MDLTKNYKYFAVSEQDRKWGAFILNTGYFNFPPGFDYANREHPDNYYFKWSSGRTLYEYQMTYLIKGKGEFESEKTGKIQLSEGQLFMLFPGVWHRYRPLKKSPWHTYWVGFNGSFVENLLKEKFLLPTNPIIDIGINESVVRLFQKIADIGQEEFAGYQQIMSGILIQLIAQVLATKQRKPFQNKGYEEIIQKAKIHLLESIAEPVKMESLAEKLRVSYSLFRRVFKEYTGMSPRQYLIQLRIEKAKELLVVENKAIKEIAYTLGFDSVFYFTRLFKDKTGFTPSQYRGTDKR